MVNLNEFSESQAQRCAMVEGYPGGGVSFGLSGLVPPSLRTQEGPVDSAVIAICIDVAATARSGLFSPEVTRTEIVPVAPERNPGRFEDTTQLVDPVVVLVNVGDERALITRMCHTGNRRATD